MQDRLERMQNSCCNYEHMQVFKNYKAQVKFMENQRRAEANGKLIKPVAIVFIGVAFVIASLLFIGGIMLLNKILEEKPIYSNTK